jgi:tetratricopeptide (TPR) repeat protein
MKTYPFIVFSILVLLLPLISHAQTDKAKLLVEQGIALNDSGKYDQALAKYTQAIKADSTYPNAYYEMGYTLFTSNREKEAIPYLEKLLAMEPKSAVGYDMLGSIYDDMKQPDKAMEYYKNGIKINPEYQRLHFNVAISYYRQGNYSESEAAAIEAIKLDPKHASSHRVYAMATFKERKRANSLLAWCNFLLLEPQSKRSPEALVYVKRIVNYGIMKKDDKNVNVNISASDLNTLNLGMTMAIINSTSGKANLSPADTLALQLNSVFPIIGEQAHTQGDTFFENYYAKFFNDMTDSGNVPAFAHYISVSAYKDEDMAWFKEHEREFKQFQTWLDDTPRSF